MTNISYKKHLIDQSDIKATKITLYRPTVKYRIIKMYSKQYSELSILKSALISWNYFNGALSIFFNTCVNMY